jgi:hypothetical protein
MKLHAQLGLCIMDVGNFFAEKMVWLHNLRSKSNIPCCALLALQVRATFA